MGCQQMLVERARVSQTFGNRDAAQPFETFMMPRNLATNARLAFATCELTEDIATAFVDQHQQI